jgi:flagellin-like hook-associated protein FlgL
MSESFMSSVTINMINHSIITSSKAKGKEIADISQKISRQTQFTTKEELHAAGKFHSYSASLEDIGRAVVYKRDLQRVSVEMEQTDKVLEQIIENVSEAKGFMTNARTPLGRDMFIETRIRDHLNTLVSHLNSRFNDKALFAGFDTDILPVDKDTVYQSNLIYDSKNATWVATSNYAIGDQSQKEVMADDNIPVNYGIVASDPAFVKIIGAYHQILTDVDDEENLKIGYDALDAAFRALTEKRADFGAKMRRVEESITSWTQSEEDLIADYQYLYGSNPAEMANLMSMLQILANMSEQNISILAMLLRHQQQILDKF